MKTETLKLYSRDFLNTSAKYHQNRSLYFRAMPFQSWGRFLRHSVVQWKMYGFLTWHKSLRILKVKDFPQGP